MGALGRLAQMSTRLRQYDSALQYARDGFAEAVRSDNLREQSSFKGDEARALLRLNRSGEALAAANEYLSLARRAHDDRLEISAYGTLAAVFMEKKAWAEAMQKIDAGLAQARATGVWDEVADFLVDLARVKMETGDAMGALACLREAAPIQLHIGRLDKLKVTVGNASRTADTLRTWPARTELLRLEIAALGAPDEGLRRAVCMDAVRTLKDAIGDAGIAASRKPLRQLCKELAEEVERLGTAAGQQLLFVNRVLVMFSEWASGETASALNEAAALDAMSAGGFEFEAFLGQGVAVRQHE